MNTRYLAEYTKKVLKDSSEQPKVSQAEFNRQYREVMKLSPQRNKEIKK